MRFLYLIVGALLGVYVGLVAGGAPTYPVTDIVWLEAPRFSTPMMDGIVCFRRLPATPKSIRTVARTE